ncbi:nucleoside deaminase [Listeria grandensis]|uniref:Nucleoside deaminase n=1 Tax=Listeria grandensis TaxID=1494963 RepID=A0A7X1CR55_9LIST|nr:nucleoside deaminase [Listeria grandensis]MBC1937717.1 nucleoside deaminase [Listeria grandensis]
MEKTVQNRVTNVENAVYEVANELLKAYNQGTFSVGGLLMDLEGNVLYKQHNNVITDNLIHDPTAHGERQMVDWYFENKATLSLPEPENIILVTSLDPCVMCTGSILQAGFARVIVSALDSHAGINYDMSATFPALSGTAMQLEAQQRFAYPKVHSSTKMFERKATSADISCSFKADTTIDEQAYASTSITLSATLGTTIVSALDTHAGINYDMSTTPPALPGTAMQLEAQQRSTYPKVHSPTKMFEREATGADISCFFKAGTTIDEQTYALTSIAFSATLDTISKKINTDLPEDQLKNPTCLSKDNPIYTALKEVYPQALEYTAPHPNQPDAGLAPYLITAAKEDLLNGGEGNAVAFLDCFGNLIMCSPGNQNLSEIQTPFILATRKYAALRYSLQLANTPDASYYLGHPKYGTFIYAKSLELNPQGVVDLGAFGSTMGGKIPTDREQFQFAVSRVEQCKLDAFTDGLPPLYSSKDFVNIRLKQVQSHKLIKALKAGLPD